MNLRSKGQCLAAGEVIGGQGLQASSSFTHEEKVMYTQSAEGTKVKLKFGKNDSFVWWNFQLGRKGARLHTVPTEERERHEGLVGEMFTGKR